MKSIRRVVARLTGVLHGRQQADTDMRAEMAAHLDMATAEYVRRGMRPDEARRRALLDAGGVTQATELARQQRGLPWIESIAADARYALRHFRRTPMSTVTMVLVLALGIGTNVVLFTILNSIAQLPPPGMARDQSVVRIRGSMTLTRVAGLQPRLVSWPEVQAYAERTDVFSGVAAHADEIAVVDAGLPGAAPATATVIHATPNYFGVLNVRPAIGSLPSAEADVMRLTSPPTAMISHAMWSQTFGGAPDVIGRILRVNGVTVEIVGVAPPRFAGTQGGSAMTLWVPLAAYPLLHKRTTASFVSPDSMFLSAAARLRPDVTADAAAPIVAGIAARMVRSASSDSASGAASPGDVRASIASGSADVVPMLASNDRITNQRDLLVSTAAAGGFALLALLVTCINVSALLVGLAVARRREIGVRLSLGAPRARLVRQLLTESVLLALIAAAAALIVTAFGIRLIETQLDDVQLLMDWRVTLATCAVALATGIVFGLSPALHATRVSVAEVLKGSSAAVAATRSRMQRALVVAQIALTQPLLVGLGVVVATMVSDLESRATSSAPDRIAEIEVDPWSSRLTPDELAARITAIVERVAAMPGVIVAMPMQSGTISAPLTVHPADRLRGVRYAAAMDASLEAAPNGYFSAFDIPVVRGRDFDASDYAQASNDPAQPASYRTVIIGSDLARRLWGDADPLGRRLILAGADASRTPAMTVIGVVDATAAGPSETSGQVRIWVPYSTLNSGVIARTGGPALPMLDEMRTAVMAAAPQLPIVRAQTLEQREAAFRRDLLRSSGAAAGGGVLALLLSAVGLYAVVAFAVGQRTREIGIRTALGARRGQVVALFFRSGLGLSALGLVLGLPLSIMATRAIAAALHWPLTTSPLLGAAIGVLVLGVASVAVWIPARRASRVDPVVALRME